MIAALEDGKLDTALTEFARLYAQNPEVIEDVVNFLKLRHHTARVTLRFHGGALQCAELERVSKGSRP